MIFTIAIDKLEKAPEVSTELVKSFKSQIGMKEQKIDELGGSLTGIVIFHTIRML